MVSTCFEGAESISDLGLPQSQPFRGFLGFAAFLHLLSFFDFFWLTEKKGLTHCILYIVLIGRDFKKGE